MISNQKTTKKGRNVVCNNSRGRPRTREAYSIPSLLVLPSHSGLKNKKTKTKNSLKEGTHCCLSLSENENNNKSPEKGNFILFLVHCVSQFQLLCEMAFTQARLDPICD